MRRLDLVENTVQGFVRAVREAVDGGARIVLFDPVSDEACEVMAALDDLENAVVCVPDGSRDGLPAYVSEALGREPDVTVVCESDGAGLSGLLMRHVHDTNAHIVAGRTDRHYAARPLFLISIPKSGTHLLFKLAQALGYQEGGEMPDRARPGHWYYPEYSNSHTVCRDFFVDTVRRSPFGNRNHPFPESPALFMYRNPMDIVVSEANYYHLSGKTAFSGYLSDMDFNQRLLRLVDDPNLLGSIRDRINGFEPWLHFPNVLPVSFEELIGERGGGSREVQEALVWSLQLKLQAPGVAGELSASLYDTSSPTFNKGGTGGGRAVFSKEARKAFAALDQDFMEAFGYAMDAPSSGNRVSEFRDRPLKYEDGVNRDVPHLVETGFLGWNIVSKGDRFFAVHSEMGALDLNDLSSCRYWLPCSPALDDLRLILMRGVEGYCEHLAEVRRFVIGTGVQKPGLVRRFLSQARRKLTGRWISDEDLADLAHFRLLLQKNGQSIWWINGVFVRTAKDVTPADISAQSLSALISEGHVRCALSLDQLMKDN